MSAEKRLAHLEGLVCQQQDQISQLSSVIDDLSSRLWQDLVALQSDHALLCEENRALSECLIGAKVLQVSNVRLRTQVCWGFSMLRSALSNEQLLLSISQLADGTGEGVARLAKASRTFDIARSAVSNLRQQGALHAAPLKPSLAKAPKAAVAEEPSDAGDTVTPDADDEAWFRHLMEREPSEEVLNAWARSVAVKDILGNFVVEDIVGNVDEMRFGDVRCVLTDMGIPLEQFVRSCSVVPEPAGGRGPPELAEAADAILRRFASEEGAEKDVMTFRDIYRLLEVIGFPLARFCAVFDRSPDETGIVVAGASPQFGSFRICREIGGGSRGPCCYLAEHIESGEKAAVKWPVDKHELGTLRELERLAPKGSPGLPRLLDSGTYERQHFMVTDLLGSSFTKVFSRLQAQPFEQRWEAISIIGRLMVRRLQVLHACGYVHCDLSPENIVLGRAGEGRCSARGSPLLGPYLVDFGLARPYPGSPPLAGDVGSAEWSSIRSAEGGERRPEDDLESLGWVLLTGLFGTLPWVELLAEAYQDWESPETRCAAIRQVQQAKAQLLDVGWDSLGWGELAQVPSQLDSFLRECRSVEANPGNPDYSFLLALLGCNPDLSRHEAETEDLAQFHLHVTPLL